MRLLPLELRTCSVASLLFLFRIFVTPGVELLHPKVRMWVPELSHIDRKSVV